ncbi:hypothetical protein XENTR_v10002150 [Xenopus tropicalis]|nr:hypothetical protein XENTR_v10002150 [Xenopus tropicalis]
MMNSGNCSAVSEFLILGFYSLQRFRLPLFLLLLLIYIVTFLENLLIIVLVTISANLQIPMYFILKCISLCELLYVTNLVPKILHDILSDQPAISVTACIIQLHMFGTTGNTMSFLYALMSYDRYVAIANPLRYTSLISKTLCLYTVLGFCVVSFTLACVIAGFLYKLEFCNQNIINHIYCDFSPVVNLSTSDTRLLQMITSLFSIVIMLFPLVFTILAYVFIMQAILRMPSAIGRKKAFSTCSSHLFVVIIHIGILFSVYVIPTKESNNNKGFSFFYIVVTPLINPIIYTLRNKEIHTSFVKAIKKVKY